ARHAPMPQERDEREEADRRIAQHLEPREEAASRYLLLGVRAIRRTRQARAPGHRVRARPVLLPGADRHVAREAQGIAPQRIERDAVRLGLGRGLGHALERCSGLGLIAVLLLPLS